MAHPRGRAGVTVHNPWWQNATAPARQDDSGSSGHKLTPLEAPLACWPPLLEDLTPHGPQHRHKAWMAKDGFLGALQADQLGHIVPGIRGVYPLVSDAMRDEPKTKFQRPWEDALDERTDMAPGSSLSVLDGLLSARREKRGSVVSPRSA